jgi:hypothetical protein
MAFRAEIIKYNTYKHSGGPAYKIFSKANEKEISLVATGRAGRIISLKCHGNEVTWSNPKFFKKLPEILQRAKDHGREHVTWGDVTELGGAKTFPAPQSLYGGMVPFVEPNLGLFSSKEIDGGVRLTSPICSESGFQVIQEISMAGQSTFEIKSQLVNRSNKEVEAAPWIVFQLLLPAVIKLPHLIGAPQAFNDFGVKLPNGILASLSNDSFSLSLKPGGEQFKAGYNFPCNGKNDLRSITATFPRENTVLDFEVENIKGPFPHGYRVETYGCDNYFEQEFLGMLQLLKPGQESDTLKVKCTLAPIK